MYMRGAESVNVIKFVFKQHKLQAAVWSIDGVVSANTLNILGYIVSVTVMFTEIPRLN
jgi:hypothetical protein